MLTLLSWTARMLSLLALAIDDLVEEEEEFGDDDDGSGLTTKQV